MIFERKILIILFQISFLTYSKISLSQPQSIKDSLLLLLKQTLPDTQRVNVLNALAFQILTNEPDKSIRYINEALFLSYKCNYESGVSSARNNLGIVYSNLGNYNLALMNYNLALKNYKKNGNRKKESAILMNMSVAYINAGQFQNALKNTFSSIAIKEALNDSIGLARAWLNLGLNYYKQKDYSNAEKYSQKSLQQYEKLNNLEGIGKAMNNLANTEYEKKNEKNSIILYQKALIIREQLNDKSGIAATLNNLGLVYEQMLNTKEAEKLYYQSYNIRKEIGAPEEIIESLINIAGLELKTNHVDDALIKLETAQALCDQSGNLLLEKKVTEGLIRVMDLKKNLAGAYKYKGRLLDINDSLYNQERQKKMQDLQAIYEFEEGEKKLKNREDELHSEQIQSRQKSQFLYISAAALFVLGGFSMVLWRINKQRKISSLKVELQKKTIEEKNKDILDSINYAQRIQQSFLPLKEEMDKILGDYFIYFKPRDIVSGDFYWAVKVKTTVKNTTNEEVIVVACADCTGHGVPGSMMSMIGNTLLNQTIKNQDINTPADALNFLNNELPKNLKKQNQNDQIRDGMDISMCAINKSEMKLYCAAANNPIWIARNDGHQKIMLRVIPDKQAITASDETQKKPFTNHSIDLLKDDVIYLFTDGYADQFGGPKGKKFKYKQMEEILLDIFNKPMNEQNKNLDSIMERWKGDLEQVDDILIIGIKI